MKLRSLHISDHPGIGDLSLRFDDPNGAIFNIITLAGANGTGKTAVLEAIQTLMSRSLRGLCSVSAEVSHDDTDKEILARIAPQAGLADVFRNMDVCTLHYDKNSLGWDAFQLSWPAQNGMPAARLDQIIAGAEMWIPYFRVFYSEAGVSFNAPTPASSTALKLDEPETVSARSGAELAQRITQLLVDISAADAEDVRQYVTTNPGAAVPPHIVDSRLRRFTRAFEIMFPTKKFRGIDRTGGGLDVQFEDHGRIISINHLSTGEKQIVFRAGFLLQSIEAVQRSLVLIDEPELSLHPDWQERITAFYVSLTTNSAGHHPQIFLATHSPFIIHGAPNSRAIILERTPGGLIQEMPEPSYASVGTSRAVRAFNLDGFISSARKPLLVLTEGETDTSILELAWTKLFPNRAMDFEVRAALGKKNINITLNDQELFTKLGTRMIVGLFDFDDAYNDWKGVWKTNHEIKVSKAVDGLTKKRSGQPGWAMLLPVPPGRSAFASEHLAGRSLLSIEFMFEDNDLPVGLVQYQDIGLGQRLPYISSSKKTEFSNHATSFPAAKFANFLPLFDRLNDILLGSLS